MSENAKEKNIEDENNQDKEVIAKENNEAEKFNTLTDLFLDYRNSLNKNCGRLQSISFSNLNADNFRKDFLEAEEDNIDYSIIIMKRLDEIKSNSCKQFQSYMNNTNRKYDEFKSKIKSFIQVKERKLSNVMDPLTNKQSILKYATQNIFIKINNILQICENIINAIGKNYELLNTFYEQTDLIDSQKQFENFLINNYKLIENSSVLKRFNFTEMDTTNLNKIDYYKFYIKYLSQRKIEGEECAKNYTIKKEELQNGIGFIMENFSILEKLKLEGMGSNDFESILQNIEINIKNNKKFNLSKLNIKNFGSIDTKFGDNKLNILQKLKIQKGTYINMSMVSKLFLESNKHLVKLSLEDINMTDVGFKTLILTLISNPAITNTLEYLSLEGNRITMIRYDKDHNKFQDTYFQNLNHLNLSRNGIYKFELFLSALPKLKFLDLTSNNIPTGSFMENAIKVKDKLVLLNDNMFITNSSHNNNIYIKYLNERMPTFNSEIKNLNLNFTYDIENQNYLKQLKLSMNVTISLIKLDLSFCGLYTDIIVRFFKNNPKFLSLRQLILRYNNIKGDFFEKIMSDEEICLDNISFIELSENEIICDTVEKLESLFKFIEKHKNLESLQLINTNFFSDLINRIKDSNPNSDKFKDAFMKLKNNLDANKRIFKFIINEGNKTFVKKEFQHLFTFKFA